MRSDVSVVPLGILKPGLTAWIIRLVVRWSDLRVVGKLAIFKATPLFPAIGYLIIMSDSLSGFFRLWIERDINDGGSLSFLLFNERLYFIYFGLMALAVSSIMFNFWCPPVVKRHETPYSFVSSDVDNLGRIELRRIIGIGLGIIEREIRRYGNNMSVQQYEEYRVIQEAARGYMVSGGKLDSYREHIAEMLILYYIEVNNRNVIGRLLCAFFMAVGFILLAVPSADVFQVVLRKIVSRA